MQKQVVSAAGYSYTCIKEHFSRALSLILRCSWFLFLAHPEHYIMLFHISGSTHLEKKKETIGFGLNHLIYSNGAHVTDIKMDLH